MNKKRTSFLLHIDSLEILNDLSDDQAGKLFKAIYSHQNNEDVNLDQITKMVFLPFKNQFIRDDEKYTKTCERRAIAGAKGGKQRVANQAIASKSKQEQANQADNKNKNKNKSDSDSDSKNNNNKYICSAFDIFWESYPKKADRKKAENKFRLVVRDLKLSTEEDLNDFANFLNFDCKKRFAETEKQFIPLATTYLNGERWNDEL